jgi:hypothetical protein
VPLETALYDTTTGLWENGAPGPASILIQQPGGQMARVWHVMGFELPEDTGFEIDGDYPLIIAVVGDATVDGTIEVWNSMTCGEETDGGDSESDDDGGGGGGYGSAGGWGGDGGGQSTRAGVVNGNDLLSPLRSGCDGGNAESLLRDDYNGLGGGALQISARGMLSVGGEINAGGEGGDGGAGDHPGGHGGGSGGAIFLEAWMLSLSGAVCANGGSGGEGRSTLGVDGSDGDDGTCDAQEGAFTPHPGDGGGGGDGGYAGDPEGEDGQDIGNGGGAGGGGGGVGRIRLRGIAAFVVSPLATVTPLARTD